MFVFFFFNTAWAMHQEVKTPKKRIEEGVGVIFRLSRDDFQRIFSFLSSCDLLNFMLTGKKSEELQSIVICIYSDQPLSFAGKNISDEVFWSIARGYYKKIKFLDLSYS